MSVTQKSTGRPVVEPTKNITERNSLDTSPDDQVNCTVAVYRHFSRFLGDQYFSLLSVGIDREHINLCLPADMDRLCGEADGMDSEQ